MKQELSVSKLTGKQEREKQVLLGLIEYYLETGKPIGSNTLQERGFKGLSSATIRNYFSNLEKQGYLKQFHSSGGRIPTEQALRLYAQEYSDSTELDKTIKNEVELLTSLNGKEIASYLFECSEGLSKLTNCAAVISAPRFDHDFVVQVKLVSLDINRVVCLLLTNFGATHTETLITKTDLSSSSIARIEQYFQKRILMKEAQVFLDEDEETLAKEWYNEVMVRFIIGYAHFSQDDLLRSGLHRLLAYPDFETTATLATSLSLFENHMALSHLLKDAKASNRLRFWIGSDLTLTMGGTVPNCSFIAIPYSINQRNVGAIGILGPERLSYRKVFSILKAFSLKMSHSLTKNIYKYKISFREASTGQAPYSLQEEEQQVLERSSLILLEDKRQEL